MDVQWVYSGMALKGRRKLRCMQMATELDRFKPREADRQARMIALVEQGFTGSGMDNGRKQQKFPIRILFLWLKEMGNLRKALDAEAWEKPKSENDAFDCILWK